jgi:hypothetical protein
MPNLDKTGPTGKGCGTGRKNKSCQTSTPNKSCRKGNHCLENKSLEFLEEKERFLTTKLKDIRKAIDNKKNNA